MTWKRPDMTSQPVWYQVAFIRNQTIANLSVSEKGAPVFQIWCSFHMPSAAKNMHTRKKGESSMAAHCAGSKCSAMSLVGSLVSSEHAERDGEQTPCRPGQ
jgi:uncharacterized membrane protein